MQKQGERTLFYFQHVERSGWICLLNPENKVSAEVWSMKPWEQDSPYRIQKVCYERKGSRVSIGGCLTSLQNTEKERPQSSEELEVYDVSETTGVWKAWGTDSYGTSTFKGGKDVMRRHCEREYDGQERVRSQKSREYQGRSADT